jgi:hypothetical protein
MFQQSGGTVPKIESHVLRTQKERSVQREKISFIEKQEIGSPGSVVKEKISLDFYKVVDNELTPESRIALQKENYMMNLLFVFFTSRGNDAASSVKLVEDFLAASPKYGDPEDPQYATFMGKVINDYRDLGDGFIEYIKEHHRPPDSIIHDNKEYRLDGIMEIAAVAKILGDPDWLGGAGNNTGYLIEGDRAKAILVDAGMSLSELTRIGANSKNIQVGNLMPASCDIHFDELTENQKEVFIGTLYKFTHCENLHELIEFLVKREGAFNSQKDKNGNQIIILDDQTAEDLIDRIIKNIDMLSKTYQSELQQYQKSSKQASISINEFNIDVSSDPKSSNSSWWPMLAIGVGIFSLGTILALSVYKDKTSTLSK